MYCNISKGRSFNIYDTVQGTLFLEARFAPGIREHDGYGNRLDIRKYLESGKNPVGLFKFTVTNIGDKMIK